MTVTRNFNDLVAHGAQHTPARLGVVNLIAAMIAVIGGHQGMTMPKSRPDVNRDPAAKSARSKWRLDHEDNCRRAAETNDRENPESHRSNREAILFLRFFLE